MKLTGRLECAVCASKLLTLTGEAGHKSGWADLNRRPLVPQTSTLNPCATARNVGLSYPSTWALSRL